MNTLSEIQAAISQLAPNELAELRDWLEELCEGQMHLSDELKSELNEAHQDITTGRIRIRHTA